MDINLEELERLAAQATPGPWYPANNHTAYDGYGESVFSTEQTHNLDNNLDYITAACNAVPKLVARVRELERQRDKLIGMYCNEMVCSWCWLDEVCPHFDETIVRRNPNSEGCRETLRKWLEEAAKEAGE